MKTLLIILITSLAVCGQINLQQPFNDCHIQGSITLYDYKNQQWIFSDSIDAQKETLPASTFKVINLLIALETGVIKDENEVVNWVGYTDTTRYGYRPEIYRDMTVKKAFEVSAGWVFIELAKRIGRKNYQHYLASCTYGNQNLTEKDSDFWNFGAFGISPINQATFLKNIYEETLPFSKRNFDILKKVMITEKTDDYVLRSKTGWTRFGGNDTGWWIGYVENKANVYFFATRLIKSLKTLNPRFAQCRKEITIAILKQIKAL